MSKPIIAVLGATGGQGGAVARALIATGKYEVRAFTRNLESEPAKKLAALGARLVQGNINSRADLDGLFRGAQGVFAVTNFWDPEIFPKDIEKEQRQGYQLVDAAAEAKVSHFIWSSLHDVATVSGGRIASPHFTGKNRVEEYARVRYPQLHSTFFYAGFYSSNLVNFPVFAPQKQADGNYVLALPVSRNTRIPVSAPSPHSSSSSSSFSSSSSSSSSRSSSPRSFDVEDSGPVVAHIFAHRDSFKNKRVLCGGYYYSVEDIAGTIAKVTGKKVSFKQVEPAPGTPQEFLDTFRWFDNYGYYNGEEISEAQRMHPKMKTLEEWLRETKAFVA